LNKQASSSPQQAPNYNQCWKKNGPKHMAAIAPSTNAHIDPSLVALAEQL